MQRICNVMLVTACVLAAGCRTAAPPVRSSAPQIQASLQRFEYIRPEMGTGFRIVLYAEGEGQAKAASDAAFARIEQLNSILSDYDPNTELSKLSQRTNDGPMAEPVRVSDDLWRVMAKAMDVARLSDGAFDITVGPFVRLWRRSRDLGELPTTQRLDTARESVGYRYVRLDPDKQAVQLLAPRMRLDVGGIGKGYAAQEASKVLRDHGISRALVGAAGDLVASDPPPGRGGWVITFQKPGVADQNTNVYVEIANQAVSTSGDTYRFVEIDGKRYSHVIDPRTGLGLTSRVGVSVIAPDGMTADSLCKLPSVLGAERGLALIERTPGAAAMVTTFEEGVPHVENSTRFKDYLVSQPTTSFSASGK